jgi:Ca2+-binding RTX toxin-like protein
LPNVPSATNTPYRDWVIGSSASDVISTGDGDDLIAGGGGDDIIDGGSGANAAFYVGVRASFNITQSLGTVFVADVSGREGRDTLTNIRFLQFADQLIDLGTVTAPAVVLEPPVVNGSTVTLRWGSTERASEILEYVLEAGSRAGASDLFSGSVGSATSLTRSVGAGAYFVRVRAGVASGVGPPSNEVSFTITGGGCAAPDPPANVSGSIANGVANIRWGGVNGATSYVVVAGSSPGFADLFNGNVGGDAAASSAVPAGFRAYVRIYAVNLCGQSAPSQEIVVQ